MKLLFKIFFSMILVFSIAPRDLYAQSDSTFQHGVALHLTYDAFNGLSTSFRYRTRFDDSGIIKVEIKTNGTDAYISRLGYEFFYLRKYGFELGLGLDLRFTIQNLDINGRSGYRELAIEIPVELRHLLSDKLMLSAGVSFDRRLRESFDFRSAEIAPEIRLGLGYNF